MVDPKAELFWSHVDRSGGEDACWPWRGGRRNKGYGHLHRVTYGESRAHRKAFLLAGGVIPVGQGVLHSCDNPPCCNPRHLRAGNQLDNTVDMLARQRQHGESTLRTPGPFDLRSARLERGLSLREAAALMCVDKMCLSRVERGALLYHPQMRNAQRIADFYGVQVSDIWPVERAARRAA